MKTKTNTKARDLIRESATWPGMRALATEYGVPFRFVRSLVDRGLVETVRLNVIRVNPESFEAYIASMWNLPDE